MNVTFTQQPKASLMFTRPHHKRRMIKGLWHFSGQSYSPILSSCLQFRRVPPSVLFPSSGFPFYYLQFRRCFEVLSRPSTVPSTVLFPIPFQCLKFPRCPHWKENTGGEQYRRVNSSAVSWYPFQHCSPSSASISERCTIWVLSSTVRPSSISKTRF
jgi:hypothetical protein